MGRCSQPEARSPQNHLTLLLKMASSTWQTFFSSRVVPTLRFAVVISYFALTVLFYIRAPSAASLEAPGFPPLPPRHMESATNYRSVGVFGDAMIEMLGPTDVPFTIFVPSHATFLDVPIFRNLEEKGKQADVLKTDSDSYIIMSHLLSFGTVPKSILSKLIPVGQEVVYESLSGSLVSVTRVPGRGFLVNNLTCMVTDLHIGQFVIHVLNGFVMDSEFQQSLLQTTDSSNEEDIDEEAEKQGLNEEEEEVENVIEQKHQSHD